MKTLVRNIAFTLAFGINLAALFLCSQVQAVIYPNAFTTNNAGTFLPSAIPGVALEVTNYPLVGASGLSLDFYGLGVAGGKTNSGMITFSSTPGAANYARIYANVTHNSGAITPANTELELDSGTHIALIPATAGGGHLQIGSPGVNPTWAFMNAYVGAGSVGTFAASDAFTLRTRYIAAGASYDKFPGFQALWTSTNATDYSWELDYFPDFSVDHNTDIWTTNSLMLERHYQGTNGAGFYWGQRMTSGYAGTNDSSLELQTNGTVTIAGNLVTLPTAAAFGQNIALGILSQVGLSPASDFRVCDGTGAGAIGNTYFVSGANWGGSIMDKGGLSINTNKAPLHAALDVWGGIWATGQVISLSGFIAPTNYNSANMVPVPGDVKLVASNNWYLAVTELSTNRAFQINP